MKLGLSHPSVFFFEWSFFQGCFVQVSFQSESCFLNIVSVWKNQVLFLPLQTSSNTHTLGEWQTVVWNLVVLLLQPLSKSKRGKEGINDLKSLFIGSVETVKNTYMLCLWGSGGIVSQPIIQKEEQDNKFAFVDSAREYTHLLVKGRSCFRVNNRAET